MDHSIIPYTVERSRLRLVEEITFSKDRYLWPRIVQTDTIYVRQTALIYGCLYGLAQGRNC